MIFLRNHFETKTISFFSKLVTINDDWSGEFVLPVSITSEHKQKAVVCKLDIKFSGLGCSKHDQYRPELSCYVNITIGIVGSEPRIKIHQIRKKNLGHIHYSQVPLEISIPGEISPKQNSACYFKALSNSLVMKIKGLPVIVKTFKRQILLPYQTVPL